MTFPAPAPQSPLPGRAYWVLGSAHCPVTALPVDQWTVGAEAQGEVESGLFPGCYDVLNQESLGRCCMGLCALAVDPYAARLACQAKNEYDG